MTLLGWYQPVQDQPIQPIQPIQDACAPALGQGEWQPFGLRSELAVQTSGLPKTTTQ